ncbi:MAG: DUF1566 domain-containing protein [Bacteroidales bacterium]|nr:DUF1566 domain-containing protein [Bacteroidales bacterium]
MSYQAVIRNSDNELIVEQAIGMRISILQGSSNGNAIYVETQVPITNTNGLISIEIGAGTIDIGDFSTINWANGPYFIKTEVDPTGEVNYTIVGICQLLSVPYALHAKTAESVSGVINEEDPVYTASPAANITTMDVEHLGNLSGTNTGDQDIEGIAINAQAIQDTAVQIRASFPDVSGFLTEERDPVYAASVARGITSGDTASWNTKLDSYTETDPVFTAWDKTTGIMVSKNQIVDLGTYVETEEDPVYTASVAANITTVDMEHLGSLSGTNTGDQDIGGIAINAQAIQDTAAQIRASIPDVNGFLTKEEDPVYTASAAANITAADVEHLGNLSGTNTGDQDIEGIAINTQAIQDTAAQIRASIPDVSGFLTEESDPVYAASVAGSITSGDTASWNAKLDSYIETDPVFTVSVANKITAVDTVRWNNKVDTLIAGTGISINGDTIKTSSYIYTIGLNESLGGYVFYVTPNGKHGLVAETQDQSVKTHYWHEVQSIIDDPANHSVAGRNFIDWRLPTKYELSLMISQKEDIGSFVNYKYWTSDLVNGDYAYYVAYDGSTGIVSQNSNLFLFRTVRNF